MAQNGKAHGETDESTTAKSYESHGLKELAKRCLRFLWLDFIREIRKFKTWVEIAALGGVIVYACITHSMWKEMQAQTCIQREASANAERAWVGLDAPPQVEIDSLARPQYSAQIKFPVNNFGKGPALNVMASARIATHGHVQEQLTVSCELLFPFVGLEPTKPVFSNSDLSKTQWGQTLFPTQPVVETTTWDGDSSTVLGQEVFVVGCIVYKDQFGNPHWTKFSYGTGPLVTQIVKDTSSFKHLYISSANNYTDDADKKPSCPVTTP